MKIEVPFFRQSTKLDCGSTALKMVFSFLGKDYDRKILEEAVGIRKGEGISTIKLAIVSSKFGFPTKLYSKSLYFDEKNLDLEYYQQHGDMDLEQSRLLIENAKHHKVALYEQHLSLDELLAYVSNDSVPIILLDWNYVEGQPEKGYHGHFVPIVGYDKDCVYVHNQELNKPQSYYSINKELFEKARQAKGTDEDIIVIFRKP